MKLVASRNKREGKFLTVRQYKLGKYSTKRIKRDYALFQTNTQCNCGVNHEH